MSVSTPFDLGFMRGDGGVIITRDELDSEVLKAVENMGGSVSGYCQAEILCQLRQKRHMRAPRRVLSGALYKLERASRLRYTSKAAWDGENFVRRYTLA